MLRLLVLVGALVVPACHRPTAFGPGGAGGPAGEAAPPVTPRVAGSPSEDAKDVVLTVVATGEIRGTNAMRAPLPLQP